MKNVATAIGLVVVFFVVLLAPIGFIWGFQWVTAPFRGALGAREQIQANGSFRIQAYQGFFNQCASIQALEGDIDAQTKALDTISDSQRKEIVQANIAALNGARSGAIFRYNQDSLKNWTEGQFKDNDLPYQLSTAEYKGTHTKCAVS